MFLEKYKIKSEEARYGSPLKKKQYHRAPPILNMSSSNPAEV